MIREQDGKVFDFLQYIGRVMSLSEWQYAGCSEASKDAEAPCKGSGGTSYLIRHSLNIASYTSDNAWRTREVAEIA